MAAMVVVADTTDAHDQWLLRGHDMEVRGMTRTD
jgi:hypothetical protein